MKTKKNGKNVCVASLDPVNDAIRLPRELNVSATSIESAITATAPMRPVLMRTPPTMPPTRSTVLCSAPTTIAPVPAAMSSAGRCNGVSNRRRMNPSSMSVASCAPAAMPPNSVPWTSAPAT
jgi:hypothetical protein